PEGRPVLALHGTPGCGAGYLFAHAAAAERGVRLLAPDRPGVGFSDLAPRRPVAAHAADVREFADALSLDTFGVVGYSGGGPYACAVARQLPDRVDALGVVAGAGQVGVWASARESDLMDRFFMSVARRRPRTASALLHVVAAAARRLPPRSTFG